MKSNLNIILILIICIGLILCTILLFRGTFEREFTEFEDVMEKYLKDVSPVTLKYAVDSIQTSPNIYPAIVTPSPPAPDAITGATPRIIAWVNNIIEQVKPAVVGICVGDKNLPSPWQQGWEIFTPSGKRSIGSGFIVHPDGYVITNYHVIATAGNISVSLFDPQGYKDYNAEVVSASQKDDLALLKIITPQPIKFPTATIGNSDKVAIGDKVIAIGNPFGLTQTVTNGIISAKRRKLRIGNVVLQNVFQTDVPINPGNSGGPLLNLKGEVIGINTAIYSPLDAVYTGVSFAIPINNVKKIFGNFISLINFNWANFIFTQQLNTPVEPTTRQPKYKFIKNQIMPSPGEGIEEIAWLGIDFIPKNSLNTLTSEVVVDEIEGISPMEAGLQVGDVVKAVNKIPIPNIYALKEAIKRVPLKVGQGIVLEIYRPRTRQHLYISFRLKKWDLQGR